MGDDARAQFIKRFKEVQCLQTQLDQYTDLTDEQREQIERVLPKDDLRAFRGAYLETAQRLKEQQGTPGGDGEPANLEVDQLDQLDFEFVLFSSAVIDYDYIMKLIAKYSGQDPKKLTISREQLIGLIQSDAKFLDEREEITEYVRSLTEGEGLDEAAIRAGYEQFKAAKQAREIEGPRSGPRSDDLSPSAAFVDTILQRMIFDGEQLTDLMEPLGLGWRERRERELALMADLVIAAEQAGPRQGHLGTQRLRARRARDDRRQAIALCAEAAVSRVSRRTPGWDSQTLSSATRCQNNQTNGCTQTFIYIDHQVCHEQLTPCIDRSKRSVKTMRRRRPHSTPESQSDHLPNGSRGSTQSNLLIDINNGYDSIWHQRAYAQLMEPHAMTRASLYQLLHTDRFK